MANLVKGHHVGANNQLSDVNLHLNAVPSEQLKWCIFANRLKSNDEKLCCRLPVRVQCFIYFWSSEIQYCGILKVADMHATGPWHYDQRRRSTEYNKIHWTDVRLTHWDLERECICLVTKYFRTKQQANSCTFSKIQTRNLPTLLHVVWLESLEHTNFIFRSDSEWSFWS